jgi:hypothetical protein
MVTDSGRFRFRSVSGETLRLAGILLDMGIDTDHLYAHLYLREYHTFAFEAYVLKNMKITQNGVASVYVSKAMQEKFGLSGMKVQETGCMLKISESSFDAPPPMIAGLDIITAERGRKVGDDILEGFIRSFDFKDTHLKISEVRRPQELSEVRDILARIHVMINRVLFLHNFIVLINKLKIQIKLFYHLIC